MRWKAGWVAKLAGSQRFQSFAARVPGLSRIARKEGEALFDLVAGFAQSQVLYAVVELRILDQLKDGPKTLDDLFAHVAIPKERLHILMQATAALGLVANRRGAYRLTSRGAALLTVPGLVQMIRHHDVFYRDLSDPVAFFRGDVKTELAEFWPYVFGAGAAVDPDVTRTYSDLMADSQRLVAEDTLRTVDFSKSRAVLDVGGGTGAFLTAVGQRHRGPALHLFDLPAVVPGAQSRFRGAGLLDRVQVHPGSFRDDPLPAGADTITLIRVLYDHADATVAALLGKIYTALPPGGRLVVSEPMTGGQNPTRAGDVYFALYTLAMQTGRARSQAQISECCQSVGFVDVQTPHAPRPFITSVVTARKPA